MYGLAVTLNFARLEVGKKCWYETYPLFLSFSSLPCPVGSFRQIQLRSAGERWKFPEQVWLGRRRHSGAFGVFTALHGMQTMRILSVRLSVRSSVCLSNAWIVTKRKKICLDFLRKTIYPIFLRRRIVGGGDPFYPKFWVNRHPLERNRRFWTNNRSSDRSASAVIPNKKNSVNTNRKSPTRFPTSLRWSSYVAPKSP